MFDKLKEKVFGKPREYVERVVHAELGELRLEQGVEYWVAKVTAGDVVLGFQVGGDLEPDRRLLEHAASIVREPAAFVERVGEFMREEARRLPEFGDEILLLGRQRVPRVVLRLRGPRAARVWLR